MAIIRAKRLFANLIQPGLDLTELPAGQLPELDPRVAADVYTVPPGKRAILRTYTAVLGSVPAGGTEPVSYMGLRLPTGTYTIRWFWHVDHGAAIAYWILTDTWNGQLVLHEGETIYCHNLTGVDLYVHGSGHELNEIT